MQAYSTWEPKDFEEDKAALAGSASETERKDTGSSAQPSGYVYDSNSGPALYTLPTQFVTKCRSGQLLRERGFLRFVASLTRWFPQASGTMRPRASTTMPTRSSATTAKIPSNGCHMTPRRDSMSLRAHLRRRQPASRRRALRQQVATSPV